MNFCQIVPGGLVSLDANDTLRYILLHTSFFLPSILVPFIQIRLLPFASRMASGCPSHSSPSSSATAAADRFNDAPAPAAAPPPPSCPASAPARERCRAPGDVDREDREGALAGEDRAGGDESLDEEDEEEDEADEAALPSRPVLGKSEEGEAGARKPNAQGSLDAVRAGCV